MLVLSRQRDETIMIGDDIEITIVDIRGDKVRLGITAPNSIPVHRKEVYEAIQRENREAAKVKMEDLNLPSMPKGPGTAGSAGAVRPLGNRPARPAAIPLMRPMSPGSDKGSNNSAPAVSGGGTAPEAPENKSQGPANSAGA